VTLARPELEVRPDLGLQLDDTWRALGAAGARWTGAERVRIIAEARAARLDTVPTRELDDATTRAARAVAAHPASIRQRWVGELAADGLGPDHYVELVAVVSRAVAIDTLLEGLGLPVEPLPEPVAGDPSGEVDHRARRAAAWVPMVGGASITQALSLVPTANAELERLHGTLYLTFEEMSEVEPGKDLSRPQMELVAARTSAHNECFY
jgi:hypothetical protein